MKAAALGVLILAHGGDASWNAELSRVRDAVDAQAPAELALGMADPRALQRGVDRLAARGAGRVVAVPLFVNSRSEVMQQTKYALGLSDEPSEVLRRALEGMKAHAHHGHGGGGGAHQHAFSLERVKSPVPVALADALDDDPFVSQVLLERAKALSRTPESETVILVAHGPNDDAAVKAWEDALGKHAASIKKKGGFRAAEFALLRDDHPELRPKAVAALRARVEAAAKAGRALIVPALIAKGGIEHKIPRDLQGLDYAWSGETLMPHPGFADWVLKRARTAR